MLHAIQFLILFVAAFSMSIPGVLAQVPPKTKHVGYLVWSSYGSRGNLERSLLDGMRDEGYVEGKNLVIEQRYVEGGIDQVRVAARELAATRQSPFAHTSRWASFLQPQPA